MPNWNSIEAFHRIARGASDQIPAMGAAGTVLVLSSPGGSISAPYGISVWAARSADGSWRVSHLRILQLPPPPQPPGTPSLPQPPERILTTGQFKPEAAQRIEAALASDCLAREPLASPTPLPMKKGPDLHCPPGGGGIDALEIRNRGTSRRYLRECGRPWASGSIIIALENPENLQPD